MPKYKSINNNFTSGQVSGVLHARIDFTKVKNGLESINNYKCLVEGGLTLRPGTKFSVEVKDSSKTTVLIPFDSGLNGNYGLEFGDLYMRVHKSGGVVVEANQAISGITKADPAIVTYVGADNFTTGDQIYITGVLGMTEVNDSRLYYTVGTVDTGANTFTLKDRDDNNVDSTSFTAYSSVGTINKIFTLTTDYAEADLEGLRWTQDQDTLTITNTSYSPRDFKRTSDIDWTITPYMKDAADLSATLIVNDGPYLKENTTTTTLDPSGTGTPITFTASSIVGINGGLGFKSTDVGRLIRWNDGTDYFFYEITVFTSTTVVDANKISTDTPANHAANATWRLGAWSDTTGFPAVSTYYQGRQWYFRTKDELDRADMSFVDDFVNFEPTTDDNGAANVLTRSNTVNAIYWATGSGKRLRLGTSRAVWTIESGADNSKITPDNIQASVEEVKTSKNIPPVDLGNITLFPSSSGKQLNELSFSFEKNSLSTRNLTRLSDDILGDIGDTADIGVKRMAYQETPFPYVWCINNDGTLAGMTYARDEDVIAWSPHPIGGTDVEVKSITSVFSETETRIKMIVKRTINGITRQYVEDIDTTFRGREVDSGIFFDSAVVVEGDKPETTLTLSATSGVGVTATAGIPTFVAGDVGRVIRSGGGRLIITGFTSTTIVTGNANDTFSSVSIASGDWNLSITSVSGLEYLEGETIRVLDDGGQKTPDEVVTNGTITLEGQSNKLVIGLDYEKSFRTLNIDAGSALGTNIGSKGRVTDVYVSVFETLGGQIGHDGTTFDNIFELEGNSEGGKGIEPQTGIRRTKPPGGWNNTLQASYKQPNGLPSTILGMTFKGEIND